MTNNKTDEQPEDLNRVFITKSLRQPIQEKIVDMLLKNGLSTVLLAIVAYVFYAKIPEHIKAIVDGNAAVSQSDREARKEMQARFEATRAEDSRHHQDQVKYLADRHVEVEKSIVESFEKSTHLLERMIDTRTNALGVRIDGAVERMERPRTD